MRREGAFFGDMVSVVDLVFGPKRGVVSPCLAFRRVVLAPLLGHQNWAIAWGFASQRRSFNGVKHDFDFGRALILCFGCFSRFDV